MIALIIGFIIGFLMCIPIGPINLMVVNTQIKYNSPARALAIAAGGSLMDLIYFVVILSGLSFVNFSDSMTTVLKAIGIVLIFALGLKDLLTKKIEMNEEKKDQKGAVNFIGAFILGVIIYTSNPTLIVTMTGLGAFVKSLGYFEFTQLNIAFNSIGLALGSFTWFVALSWITGKYQETIRNRYLLKFNRISGALMIILASYMGFKLF